MIPLLNPRDENAPFPAVDTALREPNGLLAIGGCLSVRRLRNAYRQGIFPWYSEGQPILWWAPDPRTVLFPHKLRVSRSLHKTLRRRSLTASLDRAFCEVARACGQPRPGQDGTWITDEMLRAYVRLHRKGIAHSVEVWSDSKLVGGLYGVSLGHVFFGESMFSRVSDASKVALVHLVNQLQARGFQLIDCQVYSRHLISLGAEEIPRSQFLNLLDRWCDEPAPEGPWVSKPAPPEAPPLSTERSMEPRNANNHPRIQQDGRPGNRDR